MKKVEVFLVILVAMVLCAVSVLALMPQKSQQVAENKGNTVTPAPAIENTNAPVVPVVPATTTVAPENEEPQETVMNATTYTDEDGKTYFVGQHPLQVALDSNLQQRLDYAMIESLRVYDIVRDTDVVVKTQGTPVTSRYGLGDNDFPQKVEFLRDGYTVLAWSEDLFWDETCDKVFATARDDVFTGKVFCKEHKAVNVVENVAYVNMEQGFRGSFATKDLGGEIFDAWVLVTRDVEIEGRTVRGLTWCLNTCECEGGTKKSDGGKKPVKDPTKAPTTPTPAPTEAPTTPTPAPTEAPTPTPDNNPRATVRPTDPVGDNNPRATVKPTDEAPVTDGDNNGRPDSPVDGGRPTIKPSSDDTGADGSDEGWSEDLPKVDPGF